MSLIAQMWDLAWVQAAPLESSFTVMAGRDADGTAMNLLIASQESNHSSVQLHLSGLPPRAVVRYSVLVTNTTTGVQPGTPALHQLCSAVFAFPCPILFLVVLVPK